MIGALLLGLFCGIVARLLVPGDVFRKMNGPVSWLVSIGLGLLGADYRSSEGCECLAASRRVGGCLAPLSLGLSLASGPPPSNVAPSDWRTRNLA
jgi:hypothetical protein